MKMKPVNGFIFKMSVREGSTLYIYYFICICAAFIIKGLVGFGDPLLYSPLLSAVLPNSVITPGMLPVSLIMNTRSCGKTARFLTGNL